MTDIVERLRTENSHPTLYGVPKIQADAADEIEGLRKTVASWQGIHEGAVAVMRADNQSAALDYLGQIGQLSDEIERLRAECDKAKWHLIRLLNNLSKARLSNEEAEAMDIARSYLANALPHSALERKHD